MKNTDPTVETMVITLDVGPTKNINHGKKLIIHKNRTENFGIGRVLYYKYTGRAGQGYTL